VDQAILRQLEVQTNLLRTGGEMAEQLREAKERAANETTKDGRKVERVTKEKAKKDEKGGLLGSFKTAFADMVDLLLLKKLGSILGSFTESFGGVLTKGLGALVKGAAVYGGVKFAGEMTGSKPIEDMASYAGAGATVGSIVPGLGTAAGAVIGAGVGAYKQLYDQRDVVKDIVTNPSQTIRDTVDYATKSQSQIARERTPMHVSNAGLDKIKKREGFRSDRYWDVNGWAIGYGDHEYHGHPLGNDRTKKPAVKITEQEATSMLRGRVMAHYEPIIAKALGTKPVSQEQFDSLVSVAYNSEFGGRKLARRVAKGETLKQSDFLESATVGGKPNALLQQRRKGEYADFVAQPSPRRNAETVQALTDATNTEHGSGGIAIIPMTGGGQKPAPPSTNTIIPMPMTTQNPDASVQRMRSANLT